MTFTANDIALLLIALAMGLLLGLTFSGRGKYKRLWREEQLAHRQALKDREAQIAAANAADRRSTIVTPPVAAETSTATSHDDLTQIHSVSALDQRALNEAGYHRYDQIAVMSDEQQATVEERLGRAPGTIARDRWREQANRLAKDIGARREDIHHPDTP